MEEDPYCDDTMVFPVTPSYWYLAPHLVLRTSYSWQKEVMMMSMQYY